MQLKSQYKTVIDDHTVTSPELLTSICLRVIIIIKPTLTLSVTLTLRPYYQDGYLEAEVPSYACQRTL